MPPQDLLIMYVIKPKERATFGEGSGNPLQYSCLGSPMDRGDWQATVHGAAKSRTWLSDWAQDDFTLQTHSSLIRQVHQAGCKWSRASHPKPGRFLMSVLCCTCWWGLPAVETREEDSDYVTIQLSVSLFKLNNGSPTCLWTENTGVYLKLSGTFW